MMYMSIGALQFAGFASAPLAPDDDVVPELPKPPPLEEPVDPLDPLAPPLEPKSLSPASDPQATATPIPDARASVASVLARRLILSG